MAFASLNLAERYRPWRDSGLHFLLRPDIEPAPEPDADSVVEAHGTICNASPIVAEYSPSTTTSQQSNLDLQKNPEGLPSQDHTDSQSQPQVYTPSIPSASPELSWPHPWDGYIEKLPESPMCIWSYWELGLDMAGRSSGKRRTILQKLLLKLNLPAGSVGFWPAAALHGDELLYDDTFFLRGLAHAGAPDILCFGPELYGRLFPGEIYAPRPREAHGFTFHFLPPIRENLTENSPALATLLQRVRHALRIES